MSNSRTLKTYFKALIKELCSFNLNLIKFTIKLSHYIS